MMDNVIGATMIVTLFAVTSLFAVMLVMPDAFTGLLRLI